MLSQVAIMQGLKPESLSSSDKSPKSSEKEVKLHDWIRIANAPRKFIVYSTKEKCIEAKSPIDLKKSPSLEKLNFIAFGCHGTLEAAALTVPELMSKVAKKMPIHLAVSTGDNRYPDGYDQPDDINFKLYFYDKFLISDDLQFLWVGSLGNHCHGLRDLVGTINWSPDPDTGIARAANQVAHTFYSPTKKKGQSDLHFTFDAAKFKYLSEETYIDLETLKELGVRWFMPSRCFVLVFPEVNTEYFILDSNTFLRDYLYREEILTNLIKVYQLKRSEIQELSEEKPEQSKEKEAILLQLRILDERIKKIQKKIEKLKKEGEAKQVKFFLEEYRKNPHARKIIVAHQPIYVSGKRAKSPDTHHYLDEEELKDFQLLFSLNPEQLNVQFLFKTIFKKERIFSSLDLHINSHEHAGYIYQSKFSEEKNESKESGFCQLNVGGGGGKMHFREEFSEIEHAPVYLGPEGGDGHSIATVTLSGLLKTDPLLIRLHSVSGREWCFTNQSIVPISNLESIPEEQQRFFNKLKQVFINGGYAYLKEYAKLKESQYRLHRFVEQLGGRYGYPGIQRAIKLLNLLFEFNQKSIPELLLKIQGLLQNSTQLLKEINKQIARTEFEVMGEKFTVADFDELIKKIVIIMRHQLSESPRPIGWIKIDYIDALDDSHPSKESIPLASFVAVRAS